MATNVAALKKRSPSSEVLRRYSDIARILTYGFGDADVPALIEKATAASSMKGNPIELSPDELTAILEQSL
jgi:alcohol dehydrogenase class IV